MFHFEPDVSRRGFLETSVALGAFMLPQLTSEARSAQKKPRSKARAKSVIVLLQEGGMSHLESWDPKPEAPAEIRGRFKTIATSNPQLTIGEHMPRLARQAHLYNVVRSTYLDNKRNDHSPGLHWIITGYDNQAAGVSLMKENKDPSVGSIISHELGSLNSQGLPNFVTIPSRKQLGGRVNFSGAVHLGARYEAFESGAVPAKASGQYVLPSGLTLPKHFPISRLQDRRTLLKTLDELKRQQDTSAQLQELSQYQQHAFNLLLGQRGQKAFDINREPADVRARYGNSNMGQGTLLARRLVEAGVTYVLVNYSKNNSWDTHKDNFNRLQKTLLPPMDQAVSALLEDLDERGMLDDVLVLLTGEMGRTPIINKNAGRDHWSGLFSLMIAGGGLTRGQILGSSSKHAESPKDRPVHFNEILATVYEQLGIDPHLAIPDRFDRPVRIMPEAEPVQELIRG
ncbi:MAG: DUF1501 domain-containing protein [Planctomycetes bacterium]|nr:DUF1501 domain-containing protein [Planctomycetota bacterium]